MLLITENDRQDEAILLANKLVDYACRIMALAKEKQTNIEGVIYVDNNGDDAIAYVYSYRTIKTTSSTTLDKLSQEEYGDPSMGAVIAHYNKIQNEHTLPAGTEIKIPVLTQQGQNLNNRIYAIPEMQDNYGRDIALNDKGGFATAYGDFAVIKGPGNLHQAIGNRLTTASEMRIRVGFYGLRNSIGDTMGLSSYLMASIERTLKEEPRIARVDDIQFEGKADCLHIHVTYLDINGNQNTYIGDI